MRKLGITTLLFLSLSGLYGQQSGAIVMTFAGDLNLADNVESYVGGKTDYVFARWKPGKESDIFMVNLENPVTTETTKVEKKYNFKMNPLYLQTLVDGGVTLVNCANNHAFDYGRKGIEDTIAYLDSLGIPHVGVGHTLAEARKPVIIERKGKKIGFLGYFGDGEFAATSRLSGFAPRRTRNILEDVRKLRPLVDFIVVSFHWGTERAAKPDDWQRTLAHRVIDAGADLIVGHHPHVLQGLEQYHGKWIAYSLGNFVFGGNSLSSYDTGVLNVKFNGSDCSVTLVPVAVRRWQPVPASGRSRESVLRLMEERSSFGGESPQTGAQQ